MVKEGLKEVVFIDKKRGKVTSPYFVSVAQNSHLPYKPEAKQTSGHILSQEYEKGKRRESKREGGLITVFP